MNPWQLWAKTDPDNPTRWHALPWHLYEVGAVAMELWEQSLTDYARIRLSSRLGLTIEETGRLVGFLAALHDFGKASPRFQSMSPIQVARLESIPNFNFRKDQTTTSLRHSLISYGLLVPLFKAELGWDHRISKRYAAILAAHHGRFWSTRDLKILNMLDNRKRSGITIWHPYHLALFREIRDAFGIDEEMANRLNASQTNDHNFPSYEDSLWISGLITVADWIGSDEHYFPFNTEPAISPEAAVSQSRIAAKKALLLTGWASPPLHIDASSFSSVNVGFTPRSSQKEAVDLVTEMSAPGMTVIEFPMGWGKTELALWIAAHHSEKHDVSGMYFALPTMATSDQLHERVTSHMKHHAETNQRTRIVPLHLLHGMADLSAFDEIQMQTIEQRAMTDMADQVSSASDPDYNPADIADTNSVVRRGRWFTRKKRGILARYGVGTVDQGLMSVLLSPHFFVRMFGLSGKTVIFDEVHSYDVYMSRLFDRLLEFLGAMGSPVVILSATLPRQRTQEMLSAYASGARWEPEFSEIAPYPRISAIDDSRLRSITVDPATMGKPTSLHLEWKPGSEENMWNRLGEQLQAELHDGGTVAVICNTVRSAQECFVQLGQYFPADELSLFHARFRQKDRAKIQDETLERFGKMAGLDGRRPRPHRHILVATQVVEQSLDLDFDLMVSMFAPSDLLTQRAGRLQRHRHWDDSRPSKFQGEPRLWLIGYEDNSSGSGPEFNHGSQIVYGEYVLLRSWLALGGLTQITIPDDVEALIETTYGNDPMAPPHLETRLEKSRNTWAKHNQMDSTTSESVLIPELARERSSIGTDVLVKLDRINYEPEDSPNAHISRLAVTRLGPPSISLVIISESDIKEIGFDPRDISRESFTTAQVSRLLRHAVTVTDFRVVSAARELPMVPAWEKSGHLRHSRLIVIEPDTEMSLGNATIRMDHMLGLLIEKLLRDTEGEATW